MLRYLVELHKIYQLPVIQLVIYLGKETLKMKNHINFNINNQTKINYQYKLVNISQLDCNDFITKDANLAILGILCDFKDKNKQEVIKIICDTIKQDYRNDANELKNKLLKLEIFAKLRDLTKEVKKEIEMVEDTIKITDLPTYNIGLEQGIEQGLEQGIFQEKIELIKNAHYNNIPVDTIAKIVGMDRQEVEEIIKLKIKENK
jgi:predicted transposase/invertase (TIGR01784 family)